MRQFGSLRRLPSGRWQARYLHPYTGERVSAPVTFERKTDATRWLSTVEADLARGPWISSSAGRKVTVQAWSEQWLASDPNKRTSTLSRDRQALGHFLPELGGKPLNAVTPADVQGIVARLVASQAPATVRRNVASFTSLMNAAVEADLIARSPVRGLKLPRVQAKEHPRLGPDDLARLVEATPDRYRGLVLTAGVLGLRWGELAGLRIEDVDFLRGEVRVARQLAELAGQLTVEAPQTGHGVRTLAVPPFLTRALAEHIRRFRADAALEDPALHGAAGRAPPSSLRETDPPARGRACRPLGCSHGSRAAACCHHAHGRGRPAPEGHAAPVWHADPRLTLAVYAHASDDADRSAAQRMERLFTSPVDRPSTDG